jgi:aldehyde:ferredoxin oxidoreductase
VVHQHVEEKIIEVDLTTLSIQHREVPEEFLLLGGRAFTSTYLFRKLDPACHPLGINNKIVIAPGLLAGTSLSCSNRLSVGAKSPLTGGIKESNCGGVFAHRLGRLGIKAIVLKGKPRDRGKLLGLRIAKDELSFEELSDLEGLSIYGTAEKLRSQYGQRCGLMIIGPAGEMQLASACISANDMDGEPCRNLGRGGLGAVLGSKRIKAIIVDDTGGVSPVNQSDRLKQVINRFTSRLKENPVTGEYFAKYGTARNVLILNELGALPTRNFSAGSFDRAEEISGETLFEIISQRGGQPAHGCMPGCVIRCSNKYVDPKGNHIVGSLDYETIGLLGSNIGLGNLDQIAELNRLCNEIGVDTMETGVALGVLGEAGVFEFGDFSKIRDLIEQIGKGTPVGRLIGSGCVACAKAYGIERVPAVKNQGMAAYDPRVIKGMGVTYAKSPMGADHTAGNAIVAGGPHNDPSGKVEVSKELQIITAVLDSLGMCIFTFRPVTQHPAVIEEVLDIFRGWKVSFDELKRLGKLVILREREFNRLSGIGEFYDRLPECMLLQNLPPTNDCFDITDEQMSRFYDFADPELLSQL